MELHVVVVGFLYACFFLVFTSIRMCFYLEKNIK